MNLCTTQKSNSCCINLKLDSFAVHVDTGLETKKYYNFHIMNSTKWIEKVRILNENI